MVEIENFLNNSYAKLQEDVNLSLQQGITRIPVDKYPDCVVEVTAGFLIQFGWEVEWNHAFINLTLPESYIAVFKEKNKIYCNKNTCKCSE
jgi:hypothetical protein